MVGRRFDEVIQADGLLSRIHEVLQSGVAQHDVLFDLHVMSRRDARPARITVTGIRIAEDEEARLLLTIQDLSEEERLHAARRASEQRFRDLVQGLDAIVWEAEARNLRFTFVSQRAEGLLGFPPEHWLRESDFFSLRIHREDRERALEICRTAVAAGTDHEFEYRSVAADGRVVWLRDIVHVLRDSQGRPRQLRGLTVDVTERKRAEEALRASEDQLRQAQKMEAVGQLAGGVAHDFNNLLTVIQGDSELIRRKVPEGDPLRRNVDGIREAAQRAATPHAPAPRLQPQAGDGAQGHRPQQRGGRDAGHAAAPAHPRPCELVFVPTRDVGYVKADPGQLEQVIMNLVVNARDAMPDGGRLTIETSRLELDETAVRGHGEATPGTVRGPHRQRHRARAWTRPRARASSSPSSPPRSPARAPGSGSPPCTASCARAAAISGSTPSRVRAPRSRSACRWSPRSRSSRWRHRNRRAAAPAARRRCSSWRTRRASAKSCARSWK